MPEFQNIPSTSGSEGALTEDIFNFVDELTRGNPAAATSLAIRETMILMGYEEDEASLISQRGDPLRLCLMGLALAPTEVETKVDVLTRVAQIFDKMPDEPRSGRSIIIRELKKMHKICFKHAVFYGARDGDCAMLYDLLTECRRNIKRPSFGAQASKTLASIGMMEIIEPYTTLQAYNAWEC